MEIESLDVLIEGFTVPLVVEGGGYVSHTLLTGITTFWAETFTFTGEVMVIVHLAPFEYQDGVWQAA